MAESAPQPIASPYCWKLMKKLDKSRKENLLTDVTLDVEGQRFASHRCVLASSSEFFNSLFTNDMREKTAPVVKLEGIPAYIMDDLLSYLYTGEIQVSKTNAEDLIASANFLLLPRLKDTACEFMELHTTASNCIYNYLFGEKYECKKLKSYARELIKKNFGTVARSKEFLTLGVDHVKDLISTDDIVIQAEEDILEYILEWIGGNQQEREQYFAELFRHVRLSSISQQHFYLKLVHDELIHSNLECRKTVMEELSRRAKLTGQDILPQKPRKCLQTHEDVILTCGGMFPGGLVRNTTLCYVPADKTWYQLAPMLSRRYRHGFAACQGSFYAIGGEEGDSIHCSVERYDSCTNTWSYVQPLNKGVKLIGAATLQGLLYVVGGIECGEEHERRRCDAVQRYDPTTNSWTLAAPLSSRRSSVCLVTDEHFLYSIGGLADHDFLSSLERYDPRLNTWAPLASMNEKRGCAAGVSLRKKIYVFGGTVDAFTGYASLSCEVYDITLNEWHLIPSMQVRRFHASAVLLRDQIYVFGGVGGENIEQHNTRMVECYDVETNSWTDVHSMFYEETYFRGCSVSMFKGLLDSLEKVEITH